MPRTREPVPHWRQQLRRDEKRLKKRASISAQTFLLLLGLGLVAVSMAGMWDVWDTTTTTATTGTNPAVVTATTFWSDTRVATLLGTGLVLVLAGIFFNRITAINLPGGGGITLAAAKVAATIAEKAETNPKLRDPKVIEGLSALSLSNYQDLVGGAQVTPAMHWEGGGDPYTIAEATYRASPTGRNPETPDSIAEIAVDKAIDDLELS